MGGSSGNSPPAVPDYAKLYGQGIEVYLSKLPELLAAEQQTRADLDPQRIAQQQALQNQFGPTMYQQQLDALNQLDPNYQATRELLRTQVTNDLSRGTELTPEQEKQFERQFRGAQSARGNIYGSGPAIAETFGKTALGQQLYQQRLQNAGNFLAGPTPEQQLLAIQGVSPDRTMSYVNPSAGAAGVNFGLQNYSNLLAGQQLQQNNNPWTQALGGAASGASAGAAFGPYGALIGGVAGGALGYFGSDARLKTDVHEIAKTKSGIPLIRFRYLGSKILRIGARAQDVEKVRPDAVKKDARGFLSVNYDKLADVPFFSLEGENVWQHA